MADIQKYTHLPRHCDAPLSEYVYFMYSAGRIKIGYSRDPESRQRALAQQQVPFQPVIVLVVNGTIEDEQALHIRFYADRAYGEWFFVSPAIRAYLKVRLCDAGRATLERAEADFYEHCREIVENYRAPPKSRKPRQVCEHGMPVSGTICPPCERTRDLAIVERINNGTYSAKSVDHA